jgi:hypothetical protein
LIVLEIDPRNGGDRSYAQLQQELPNAFTALFKVRTASGGFQLYFVSPKGEVPSRANIRPGIDVRADGDYVVAPPFLDESGERYRFTSNSWVIPLLPEALRPLILDGTDAHTSGTERANVDPAKPNQISGATSSSTSVSTLVSRKASEIKPEAISWMWPGRIASGKVSVVVGEPGGGKSQVTMYKAATVSRGGNWCTGELCAPGDVLIFSAEDDPSDTIVPRLQAYGADLDRIHIIEGVKRNRTEQFFNLKKDLDVLAEELRARPQIKMIIIDPINSYLGDVDSHKDAAVRGVLGPLAKLARDHHVAIVCVTHLNKSKDDTAPPLNRIMGSAAFGAAPRTAFLVAPDRDDPDRRLLLHLKTNVSKPCEGLAYRIDPCVLPSGIETSQVVWEREPVTITAREALGSAKGAPTGQGPSPTDDAKLVEACLRVFESENAAELRSSELLSKLKLEGFVIDYKKFKDRVDRYGIAVHAKSDANYYVQAEFSVALTRPPLSTFHVPPSNTTE